jgi:hypothetical protein
MSRKLLLHIGAHKTGTTAIQTACHKNLDRLRAQNWDFAFMPGRPFNWGFAVDYASRDSQPYFRFSAKWGEKLRETLASEHDNVILSAEDLFFLEKPEIEEFCTYLNDLFDEICVIAYLRRQDEMAVSQKAQGAKTIQSALLFGLSPHPLPDLTPGVRNYLNFAQKLSDWQAALPDARLTVREYNRKSLRSGDIVADFSALLGLPLPSDVGDVNTAMGTNAVRFLLSLRAAGLPQRDIEHFRLCGWIDRDGPAHLPTAQEARNFFRSFEADNASLPEIAGDGFGFHDDFSRYPEDYPDTDYESYERLGLIEIIRQLTQVANPDKAVALKTMAQKLEQTHPKIAERLTEMAYEMKPHGPAIKAQYFRMFKDAAEPRNARETHPTKD